MKYNFEMKNIMVFVRLRYTVNHCINILWLGIIFLLQNYYLLLLL